MLYKDIWANLRMHSKIILLLDRNQNRIIITILNRRKKIIWRKIMSINQWRVCPDQKIILKK